MIKLRVRITQIAKINMFWVYLLFVCVSVVCARIYKKVGHRCFFGHELVAQFRNHNLIFEWLLFKNWFNLKIYFQIQQLNFLQNVFFFLFFCFNIYFSQCGSKLLQNSIRKSSFPTQFRLLYLTQLGNAFSQKSYKTESLVWI